MSWNFAWKRAGENRRKRAKKERRTQTLAWDKKDKIILKKTKIILEKMYKLTKKTAIENECKGRRLNLPGFERIAR